MLLNRESRRAVWDDLKGQIYLGTPAWVERMRRDAAASGALPEVPRAQRLPEPAPLAEFALGLDPGAAAHPDRRLAMREAVAGSRHDRGPAGRHTLRAIAQHFKACPPA